MMKSETSVLNAQSERRRDQEIDRRYGAIGIAAVAAAVRCQSWGKPAQPVKPARDDESERAA